MARVISKLHEQQRKARATAKSLARAQRRRARRGRDEHRDVGSGVACLVQEGRHQSVEHAAGQPGCDATADRNRRDMAQLTQAQPRARWQARGSRVSHADRHQRQAEQGSTQRKQLEAFRIGEVERELAAAIGRVGRDHVEREHRAARVRSRLGVQPALGRDEQSGAAEARERTGGDPEGRADEWSAPLGPDR